MNVPRTASPKFSSVSLYGQHFSRYCTFYDFPIEFYLKISKCYIFFKTWLIAKKLYSTMVVNGLMKIDWRWVKPVGGVAFSNFQSHIVLC